jgi:flagellar protein FliO/FliZ
VSSLFGTESRAILFVVAFAIILALVALFGLVLRKLTGARLMMPGSDRSRSRQPRLGIVDVYDLDRQRQLLLLRRDNVEHLLLIGGPNDVVIETNIVRVAGARIPAPASEPVPERFEPQLDQAPRAPQVEPNGRPSIEAQLAAQLGSFVRRPNEDSDAGEELAPVASISAPVSPPQTPLAPEPVLKPDAVNVSANPVVQGLRAEARAPVFPSAPEPVVERPEPRPAFTPPAPPPFQSRATPTAPVPPVTPPVAPEPVRPFQPAPVEPPAAPEKSGADPVALSNMAKQLEEALKRPAAPVPPPPMAPIAPAANDTDYDDVEDDDFLEPGPIGEPLAAYEEHEEDPVEEQEEDRQPQAPRPAPEPVRPAPSPLPPQPAESGSKDKAADPFSVEEIEAEFARLLGRPVDTNKKG